MTEAWAWVGVLAIAAAPGIPLAYVSGRLLAHGRALWLLGLLAVGVAWLGWRAPWLAVIGVWFLLRWPRAPVPSAWLSAAVHWAAVGATWGLLLALPHALLGWAPWGWLAVAGGQTGLLVARKACRGGRPSGTLGSPVLTALFLALVSPFSPWWGWPLLGAGLVIVWSWSAWVAVACGMLWLYPGSWLLMALGGLVVAILWAWSPTVAGQRLLEWTPRGDTIDSLVSRWRGWQCLVHHGRAHWLLGAGPGTMEPALLRWGSRYDIELCWGEGFNELLQLWYEYGMLGVLAVGAFVWRVWPGLTLGDPWSAAWVVGVVLTLGHWPLRHVSIGLVWLAISAYLVTR